MKNTDAEILAPVGSNEMLIAAVRSGADAVYFGAKDFSARRNAENFGTFELRDAIEYCHIRGVKAYLTLNILIKDDEMTDATLSARIMAPSPNTGEPDFTHASALSFMVFILLYSPCIASITAIIKETENWKYGAFAVLYNTVVAWIMAFVVYQVASLF